MLYKITPSLYNAWLAYAKPLYDRDEQQELDARDEFLRALSKEPAPETDAMRRGVWFESLIMRVVDYDLADVPEDDPTADDVRCAEFIGDMVRDGVFQVKDGRELPSGNYIYGVADCILLNGVVDFKRVSSPYEMGKYQKSIQHLAYMYIWQLPQFYYVIADGGDRPFFEPYIWDDSALDLLESRVSEMIGTIERDPELARVFAENWEYKKINLQGEKSLLF